MKLHRLAVFIDGTAAVARATGRAIESFDRARSLRTGTVIALVGAGAAIGALATSPALREQLRNWLSAGAAENVPRPHANGAVPDVDLSEDLASG